jgi:16S rRNA (adenine1518-N6/adenine1519-N6)-dimethyltransferase
VTAPNALPPLRDVIARHRLNTRHSLGQHFLLDLNLTDRIARIAGDLSGVSVIEIGPGPGGLTRSLLEAGAPLVVVVEKDQRCIAAIGELAAAFPERLRIIEADALEVDVRDLAPAPRKIVANLPFNVGTPLLLRWLRDAADCAQLTLRFEKEVADRLVARARTPAYGRLSIMAQWLCDVRRDFNVDARAFVPPPRVTSTVVTLIPRDQPLAPAERTMLEAVAAAAFGQRRKMLRRSLKPLGIDPVSIGIDPTHRAEDLSVEEFCGLARLLAEHRKRPRR